MYMHDIYIYLHIIYMYMIPSIIYIVHLPFNYTVYTTIYHIMGLTTSLGFQNHGLQKLV